MKPGLYRHKGKKSNGKIFRVIPIENKVHYKGKWVNAVTYIRIDEPHQNYSLAYEVFERKFERLEEQFDFITLKNNIYKNK